MCHNSLYTQLIFASPQKQTDIKCSLRCTFLWHNDLLKIFVLAVSMETAQGTIWYLVSTHTNHALYYWGTMVQPAVRLKKRRNYQKIMEWCCHTLIAFHHCKHIIVKTWLLMHIYRIFHPSQSPSCISFLMFLPPLKIKMSSTTSYYNLSFPCISVLTLL